MANYNEEKLDYASTLRHEFFNIQERRHAFSLRKLSFVTALFSLSSVNLQQVSLTPTLYLIPIVAFAFDMYILSEDYRIKRIGEFWRQEKTLMSGLGHTWEKWVKKYPNPISPFTATLVTSIVLAVAAAGILLWEENTNRWLFCFWLGLNIIGNVALATYSVILRKRFAQTQEKES